MTRSIFVFGSNLAGIHGAGAALFAFELPLKPARKKRKPKPASGPSRLSTKQWGELMGTRPRAKRRARR